MTLVQSFISLPPFLPSGIPIVDLVASFGSSVDILRISHGNVFGGSCFIFQDDEVPCHHFHGFDMNNSHTSQELSSSRIPRL